MHCCRRNVTQPNGLPQKARFLFEGLGELPKQEVDPGMDRDRFQARDLAQERGKRNVWALA